MPKAPNATKLLNELPKSLQTEMRKEIPKYAYTDEVKQRTLKPEWGFIVVQNAEAMIRQRQEMLRMTVGADLAPGGPDLKMLMEIEVLRLTLADAKKES